METMLQDLRFAARTLARQPAFTAIAVLTLALGIGANTAIYSLVDATLLASLPFRDPGPWCSLEPDPPAPRLRRPLTGPAATVAYDMAWSYPEFETFRQRSSRSFRTLALYRAMTVNLTGTDQPELLSVEMVGVNVISPVLGDRRRSWPTFSPTADSGAERDLVEVIKPRPLERAATAPIRRSMGSTISPRRPRHDSIVARPAGRLHWPSITVQPDVPDAGFWIPDGQTTSASGDLEPGHGGAAQTGCIRAVAQAASAVDRARADADRSMRTAPNRIPRTAGAGVVRRGYAVNCSRHRSRPLRAGGGGRVSCSDRVRQYREPAARCAAAAAGREIAISRCAAGATRLPPGPAVADRERSTGCARRGRQPGSGVSRRAGAGCPSTRCARPTASRLDGASPALTVMGLGSIRLDSHALLFTFAAALVTRRAFRFTARVWQGSRADVTDALKSGGTRPRGLIKRQEHSGGGGGGAPRLYC